MTLQISTDEFMRRYGEMMDEGVRFGTADAEALAGMFAEYFVGSSPSRCNDECMIGGRLWTWPPR